MGLIMDTNIKSNLAFKFNYCNGRIDPDDKRTFGFSGVCSKDFISYNIEKRKADWCSNPLCPCMRFYKKEISYDELCDIWRQDGICTESKLLSDWTASAEYSYDKFYNATPRPIRNAEEGSLCILTAVRPRMNEQDRKIFGAFLIGDVFQGDDEYCGFVSAHEKYHLEFTLREANDLIFWDFYQNENTSDKRWGQGVFRYMNNDQAAAVLQRICQVKSGAKDELLAKEMLEKYLRTHKC